MEQAQYKQLMASLEGLTEAQLDELRQVLRQRQEADGVQRLIMARLAQEGKAKDGSGTDKTAVVVVVAVQRGTQVVFHQVLERATGATLTEALRPVLGTDAVLSTAGNAAYWKVAEQLKVESGYFVSQYHGKGGHGPWHVQSVTATTPARSRG